MTSAILFATYFNSFGSGASSLIGIVFGLVALGGCIYVAVDANKYSDQAHQAAGFPKMGWVIGPVVIGLFSCFCCPLLALPPVLGWFLAYKKRVEGAGNMGYGAMPQGGFPPPPDQGFPPPPDQSGGFPPPPGQ